MNARQSCCRWCVLFLASWKWKYSQPYSFFSHFEKMIKPSISFIKNKSLYTSFLSFLSVVGRIMISQRCPCLWISYFTRQEEVKVEDGVKVANNDFRKIILDLSGEVQVITRVLKYGRRRQKNVRVMWCENNSTGCCGFENGGRGTRAKECGHF